MHILRTFAISTTAALMLFATPAADAQNPDNLKLMQTFLSIMNDYMEIIEATHGVASDPEKAAIMQMQKIQEVYEQRGEKARSTEVLKQVLSESRNLAIRNAAYIMLGDTLKETGRADEAIDYLQQGLMENINAAN